MRTTITLEPDVEALIKRAMEEGGVSFKVAVNTAVRRGLTGPSPSERFKIRTSDLGEPRVPIVKALRLAGEMEDEAIIDKMRQRR